MQINRTKDSGIIISGLPGVLSHGNLLNFRCSQLKAQNTVSIVSSWILTSHQPHRHTASIAFRHPPPNSARFGYATEGALFISAQLSTDAVRATQKVWELITLRASLSGTFLQTLPDLVRPLKGHSLSPRSCPPTRSAPSERFGY